MMKDYDIVMANSLFRLSEEELKSNNNIFIKAPDDEIFITEDFWKQPIAFLLEHDCYSYTIFGDHSEKLHDLIDDIAFDIFPFIKNKHLSYENDHKEINDYCDLLSSKLITVWERDLDGEGFDDLLAYMDYKLVAGNNIIVLKELEKFTEQEYFIKYNKTALEKIKQIMFQSFGGD